MRLSRFSLFLFAFAMLLATVVADAEQNASALVGRWEGAYVPKAVSKGPGKTRSKELGSTRGTIKLPVTVMIMAGSDGKLTGTWVTTGPQGPTPMEIAISGDIIRFTMPATMASWEGKFSEDGSKLDGKWQGRTFGGDAAAPLVLRRSGS